MLFIVPWLAAGMRPGMALARAPRRTSTIRWEVSTFPAAVAAGKRALMISPGGATISKGRRSPVLTGMSSSMSDRKT